MARRPIIVRLDRNGFVREESFLSKTDAEYWRDMMNETLDMPQAAALNLHVYAEGLGAWAAEGKSLTT